MGNRNTTAEKWDSSDEGGSDYEHKYDFHTSVLRKSPYDGFESDYEDEDECVSPVLRNRRRNLVVAASSPVEPQQIGDGGDGNSADKETVSVVAETAVSSAKGEALGGEDGGLKPEGAKAGDENTAPGPVTVSGTATPRPGSSTAGSKNKVAEGRSQAQEKSSPSQTTSAATRTLRGLETEQVDVEDVYETAREGAGDVENDAEASDNDSLSTITPPRMRPQSDSEYSIDMESDSDEEEDSEEGEERSQRGEHNTMTTSPHGILSQKHSVKTPHRGNRSPAQASGHTLRSSSRTSPSSQRPLPHRGSMSPNSYRQTRKRRLTPPESRRAEVPRKRMKQITLAAGSPTRVHYGYISSDSESEPERNGKKRSSPRMASPSEQVRGMRETRALTARTIRQAARRAATQIVETSWKIMKDAKAAAKKIRGSASKRRSSAVDDGIEMTTAVKPSMVARREWKDENRNDGSSDSDAARATRSARTTVKRKASPAECSPPNTSRRLRHSRESRTDHVEPDHSYPQADTDHRNTGHSPQEVRKNGGLMRKFTRNQHSGGESSGSQVPPSSQVPVVILSASNNQQKIASKADSIFEARVCTLQHTKVKSTSERANPFSSVLLVPTSQSRAHSNNGAFTDSTDSISMELDPAAQNLSTNLIFKTPFSSLLTEPGTPQPVTFTSGSVWARVNMRTNHPQQTESGEPTVQEKHSPTLEPSGHRMATRSSPLQVNSSPQATNSSPQVSNSSPQASNSSPQASNSGQQSRNTSPQLRNSSPQVSKPSSQQAVISPQRLATLRVPSLTLTLTGQFAQSGRFAFLLEDVLQVTVISGDITKTSTNAIVISTDRQLRHQNPLARSVATAAGPGFGWACQEYLSHNTQGLQVCEVLDTPAGGQLPKQTSRVLHVVVPGVDNPQESGDFVKERKMLLCTFVNCLKYASEKLKLNTIAFPLVGAGTYPADECIQVFFDSLLVYLAERTCTCPLHGIHLVVNNAAIGRFAAEVLESRLEAMVIEGVDSAITAVFKDYFNIPDFMRGGNSSSAQAAGERNLSGKPAVKRRRL